MRAFRILFIHELRALAIATPTYVAGAIFLLLMGGIYWAALNQAVAMPRDQTPVEDLFRLFPLPLFFIVPLLTMRSFAEERRLGTLGALMSMPIRPVTIVLAKFAAAYALYLMLWGLSMLFPFIGWWMLQDIYNDPRLLSLASMQAGYAFIAVSGTLYIATGILASSLTRSTLVAALLTFCALFLLVTLGWLFQQIPMDSNAWITWLRESSEYFDTFKHLDSFIRGIIDTRSFVLFGSGALLALGLTTLTVESKA